MARIAISLCGEGRGHAARIGTLVDRLAGRHEFLIATTTEALELLRGRFGRRGDVRFVDLPGIRFRYVGGRLAVSRTIVDGLWFGCRDLPMQIGRLTRELERFGPDLAITDFEPVLPRVASRLGLPLVSLDHQHFLAAYDLRVLPPGLRLQAWFMSLACRLFVPQAAATVVSAFFQPPLVPGWRHAVQVGPLLRPALLEAVPHDGSHVVSYLRRHTPAGVVAALCGAGVPVRIYGLGRREPVGRVSFHEIEERRFVDDLAGCHAVVAAAGNQLIGEAIHLGKPLFVLPERAHAEQAMNARFLVAEGCGQAMYLEDVTAASIREFLDQAVSYVAPLSQRRGRMDGFPAAAAVVSNVLAAGCGGHQGAIGAAA